MNFSEPRKYLGFLAIVGALVCCTTSAHASIDYYITLDLPGQHEFHVAVVADMAPSDQSIDFQMPAWNALYQVRDFAYRVREVQWMQPIPAGKSVFAPEKIDKQTWRFKRVDSGSHGPWSVAFTYSVYWDDPGPFSSQLNSHHAFMNLAEILMYVPNRRNEESIVYFDHLPAGWSVAAELAPGKRPNSFVAPSYDALVDAPVEAGKFDDFRFDSGGGHFRVVVDASNWNRERLEDALRRITAYELQLMGGAPFSNYTFFFHIGPEASVGGGGMEHANSSEVAASSLDDAISIAAHEFFHVWNVKRIRPQSLEPVDYTREQYTRALWFAEGVTNTYCSFALERTGLWPKRKFYDDLAAQIERLQIRPARRWQSVEESSLDAWFEKYEGYDVPDRSISYYDKGQIVGVLVDLEIRDATDNHKSLDDVLRLMNETYAKPGKFYNDSNGVRAAVEEVAGQSFEDFFRRYVSGVDEIPYNDFLKIAGLELKIDTGFSISEIAHPTERQRRIREGLLHGSTD